MEFSKEWLDFSAITSITGCKARQFSGRYLKWAAYQKSGASKTSGIARFPYSLLFMASIPILISIPFHLPGLSEARGSQNGEAGGGGGGRAPPFLAHLILDHFPTYSEVLGVVRPKLVHQSRSGDLFSPCVFYSNGSSANRSSSEKSIHLRFTLHFKLTEYYELW